MSSQFEGIKRIKLSETTSNRLEARKFNYALARGRYYEKQAASLRHSIAYCEKHGMTAEAERYTKDLVQAEVAVNKYVEEVFKWIHSK